MNKSLSHTFSNNLNWIDKIILEFDEEEKHYIKKHAYSRIIGEVIPFYKDR